LADRSKLGGTSKEPLGPNPFPKEDSRHEGWIAASRIARKNLMTYNSLMLPKKPDLRGPAKDCKAWWVDYLAGRFSIMGSVVLALFGTTFEGLEAAEELLDHFAESTVSQAEDLDRRRLFDAVIVPDLKLKIVEYRESMVGKGLEWLTQKETQAPAKPPEAGRPPQGLTPRPAAAETDGVLANKEVASLSARDERVHDIIGEQNFRALTNTEIMKNRALYGRLRQAHKLTLGDAAKSCLDRIRRAKGYPMSREITKKRSG
jgi:hypothetical protein